MTTTYIVTACISDKRWFDLDSERIPAQDYNPRNTNGTKPRDRSESFAGSTYDERIGSNPAGAPPLDCWIDLDEHAVTRRLIRLMCPQSVCTTCGEPRRRLTQATDEYASRPFAGRDFCVDAKNTAVTGQTERNGWRGTAEYTTLGWSDCGHNTWRRGVVYDPFSSAVVADVAAEQDREIMTTTYIVTACISDKRWFDLDAERAVNHPDRMDERAMKNKSALAAGTGEQFRMANGRGDGEWNPAGAPPLDCWIDPLPEPPADADQEPSMSTVRFHIGDVFTEMAKLPDNSVDLIVTSPPFLALRSYLPDDHPDKHLEIGSEPTPAAYLTTLLALTREWRRILTPYGSIAVELGDTYSGSGGAGGDYDPETGLRAGQPAYKGSAARKDNRVVLADGRTIQSAGISNWQERKGPGWPLPKSLCLIPTLYAGSLAYGYNLLDPDDRIDPWRVRNLIVWHRPNPPVGALGDKVRPSTSYITTACTSASRWFDLDAERGAGSPNTHARLAKGVDSRPNDCKVPPNGSNRSTLDIIEGDGGAPPLDCWIEPITSDDALGDGDVWTIPTHPYKGAHYATYPPALPRRLIRLMCPMHVCVVCGEPRRRITQTTQIGAAPNGDAVPYRLAMREGVRVADGANQWKVAAGGNTSVTRNAPTLGWSDCGHNTWRRGHVLDPFAGSGTTGQAAIDCGRDATLIDLDSRNLELARQRLGLFLEEGEQV